MEFYNKVKSQQDQPDQGELKVGVFTEDGTRPVENALVRISYTCLLYTSDAADEL